MGKNMAARQGLSQIMKSQTRGDSNACDREYYNIRFQKLSFKRKKIPKAKMKTNSRCVTMLDVSRSRRMNSTL